VLAVGCGIKYSNLQVHIQSVSSVGSNSGWDCNMRKALLSPHCLNPAFSSSSSRENLYVNIDTNNPCSLTSSPLLVQSNTQSNNKSSPQLLSLGSKVLSRNSSRSSSYVILSLTVILITVFSIILDSHGVECGVNPPPPPPPPPKSSGDIIDGYLLSESDLSLNSIIPEQSLNLDVVGGNSDSKDNNGPDASGSGGDRRDRGGDSDHSLLHSDDTGSEVGSEINGAIGSGGDSGLLPSNRNAKHPGLLCPDIYPVRTSKLMIFCNNKS
jgi:hypothetical protein